MERLSKHWVFIVLLLIGLIVRLIFISEQGFSNDELSAWYRTKYTDWNSFWNLGVKYGDMHPAFYQVLLWIWVRIFGDSEFSIRATSLLFYLLNSYLVYRISCKHFTQLGGLLMQGLYVGLTFTVINTVFARPYNSGTFFLLLAFWSVMEFKETKSKWKWTFMLSLGLIGAMLSHYFAFFTAVIIGFLALFFVGKRNIIYVILAGGIASMLFIPHLEITLFQITRGGLGWLAPPDLKWTVDFIHLFFNESWFLFLTLLVLFIVALIYFGKTQWSKKLTFSIGVFICSYLGAYLISYLFTPILRDLVMLFILPFALLPFLSLIKFGSNKSALLLIAFVTIIPLTDSLIRNKLLEPVHYGVFKENGLEINRIVQKYGKENITFASNYNNVNYINYYLKDHLQEEIVDWEKPEALYSLAKRAKSAETKYFCYSYSNKFHSPMFLEVIRKHYPILGSSMTTKFTCVYLFSKNGERTNNQFYFSRNPDTTFVKDEFLSEVKVPMRKIPSKKDKNDYYLLSCIGEIEDSVPLNLVVTVERKGQMLMDGENPKVYTAYNQTEFSELKQEQEFFTAFDLPEDLLTTDVLKIYCWNPEKGSVRITSVSLRLIRSNE